MGSMGRPEPQHEWPVRWGEASQVNGGFGSDVHHFHRGQVRIGNWSRLWCWLGGRLWCRFRCRRGSGLWRGRRSGCGCRRGRGGWGGLRSGRGCRRGRGGWGRRCSWGRLSRRRSSGRRGGSAGRGYLSRLGSGSIGGLRESRRSPHAVLFGSRLRGCSGGRGLRRSGLRRELIGRVGAGRRSGGRCRKLCAADHRRLGVSAGGGNESEDES